MSRSDEYGIWIGDKIYDTKDRTEPIIDNFLYKQDFMAIHAEEGIGKSVLTQQLKHNLTTGQPFLGAYSVEKPCKVLWAQSEGARAGHIDRVKDMRKCVEIDDNNWAHMNTADICFDYKQDTDRFIEMARSAKMEFDVIVMDSLYGFVDGDMNSNKTAKDVTRNIRRIAGEFQAAVIVITHVGKDQYTSTDGKKINKGKKNMYGARHWAAFFTQIYLFSVKRGIHTLEKGKDRDGNCIAEIQMKMLTPQDDPDERLMFVAYEPNEKKVNAHKMFLQSQIASKGRVKNKDLLREMDEISNTYYYKLLNELEQEDIISREKDENRISWVIYKNKDGNGGMLNDQ